MIFMNKYKGLSGYKVRFIFAWYDLWVGIFIDKAKHKIYFFPIPMFGIVIESKYPKWWK